jgi:hypothetical protein
MVARAALTLALLASVTPAAAQCATMASDRTVVAQPSAGSDDTWCPTSDGAWVSEPLLRLDSVALGRGVIAPTLTGTWAMHTSDGRPFDVIFAQSGTTFVGQGTAPDAQVVITGTMAGDAGTGQGEYRYRGGEIRRWTARIKLFGGGDAMTWSISDGARTIAAEGFRRNIPESDVR